MRRFWKVALAGACVAASLAIAMPVAASGSVSPAAVSMKAVTVVPVSQAFVQTTGASPALTCLAYAYVTAGFNYAGGPDSYQMKGTACLNGSNSWGTGPVSWKSTNGAGWTTASGPSYFNTGGNTTFWINGYGQYLGSNELYPRIYLWQSGTTWYERCYDGANSQYFVNCAVS